MGEMGWCKKNRARGGLSVLLVLAGLLLLPSSALASLSWSAPQLIDEASPSGGIGLTGISCASPTFCAAIDEDGNVLTSTNPTGGTAAWSKGNIDGDRMLFSVSCPSAGFCAVIGVNELGGASAFTSTNPTSAGSWHSAEGVWADEAVSCPTSSFCAASGFGEISTSTNPTGSAGAWIEGTSVSGFLPGISCPSAGFCAAANINPVGVWTSTDPTGGTAAWLGTELATSSLSAIACPSRSFCAVGDVSNNIHVSADPTGGATTWQLGGTDPESSKGFGITGIACPTVSFCTAVDDTGHALESADPTGGAAAWTVTAIDAPHSLTDVSCPVAWFCAAVDTSGNLLTATGTSSLQHTLTVSRIGSGAGTIDSAPFGIVCGATCSHAFDDGTPVTLEAKPAAGSTFAGWSGGGCSGTGECEVTVGANADISATFTTGEEEPEEEPAPSGGSQGSPLSLTGGGVPGLSVVSKPAQRKKPLKCRKGFKKRKVHGKAKCVKPKRHRRAASSSVASVPTSNLEQECVQAGLAVPSTFGKLAMHHAGLRPLTPHHWQLPGNLGLVPRSPVAGRLRTACRAGCCRPDPDAKADWPQRLGQRRESERRHQ
jgi:hypothetical protein